MNIYRLMVHSQKVEEAGAKRKIRDAKGPRYFDVSSSKGRLDKIDNYRLKKKASNQVPSNFLHAMDDRVSNPKPQKGGLLLHQLRIQLVKCVATSIIVIKLGKLFWLW